MHHRYIRYLDQNTTIVFATISAIKLAKLYLSSSIIRRFNSFGYVIYFMPDAHGWPWASTVKYIRQPNEQS